MRRVLAEALAAKSDRPELVFLTGDLGFDLLEPVQWRLKERFINAGVAEQNMIGVAAGLAREGMQPWVYSIAPFLYARPFEQIRNDVAFQGLSVRLVGNGGGYAYGPMGPTHHALEDYGVLLALPGVRVAIPVFNSDVSELVPRLISETGPWYLRLGRDEAPADFKAPKFSAWRRLIEGAGPVVLAVGPLAGGLIRPVLELPERCRPTIWAVSELPIPEDVSRTSFGEDVARADALIVVEEHVANGGVGEALASRLLSAGCAPRYFRSLTALGYPSGRYGSQAFHRRESGIDADSVIECVKRFANGSSD